MTIRVIKDGNDPFVRISNLMLKNSKISFKAKGLLAYLLSLPDDWQIYVNQLSNVCTDKKSSIQSAIQELIDTGYMTKDGKRKPEKNKGQFGGYHYTVHEKNTM
jgi:predicted transcriptional regulator